MIRGDARHLPIASNSVDLIVTSPPYLKQRKYGTDKQREIGLDDTLATYVQTIADVFDEARRVLKRTGWAFLNIADRANNSGGAGGDWNKQGGAGRVNARSADQGPGRFFDSAFLEQSYLDVPGAVLAELIRRGWRLRCEIIWDKGREAPEALAHVRRPRWAHEPIFMLQPFPRPRGHERHAKWFPSSLAETGSVWHFPPGGNGDSHLAPFPDELARRCILPTTQPGDVVLDPFCGSGTTARVAREHGRIGIGVELYAGRPDLINGGTTTWKNSRRTDLVAGATVAP